MGKVRVKSFDDLEEAAKAKRLEERRATKKGAKKTRLQSPEAQADGGQAEKEEAQTETASNAAAAEEIKEPARNALQSDAGGEKAEAKPEEKVGVKKAKKEKFQKEPHSVKYNDLSANLDRTKTYSLSEGLELLGKMQRGKFDETVELHINTLTLVSGNVTLPHGTGKKTKVAIADDNLIAQVEKGVINFDILVATPDMMPKLAKVAKVLGPRGLMPNPKNGTITQKPEEVVKKYEGGQINFKTETKSPLLHLTVGKMSFGNEKLSENIEAMVTAVKKDNIVNVTLKSTMSPGIKIRV